MNKIEIRELDNSVELSGYISVCRCDSKKLRDKSGEFVEQIMNGAFKRSLRENPDIPVLFNHKWDRELGRNGLGNCELYEDNIGLRYKITTDDEEVVRLAKAGKLQGTSFGFNSLKETSENLADGLKRRFVHELRLLECSILSVEPAYLSTSVECRADDIEDVEIRATDFSEQSKAELESIQTQIAELQAKEKELLATMENVEGEPEKVEESQEQELDDSDKIKNDKEIKEKLRSYLLIQRCK